MPRYHGPQRLVTKTTSGTVFPAGPSYETALFAEKCRRSLRTYMKHFWEVADPAHSYIDCKVIHAVSDHLEALHRGEISKLAITIPPGHAKSLTGTVLYPSWQWTSSPTIQSLCLSHDPRLASRDSSRCRMVIESDKYQNTFDPDWTWRPDQNEKTYYVNTKSGSRYSYGYYSSNLIGWRGDQILIDDPLPMDERFNPLFKRECIDIMDNTLSSRFNDKKKAKWLLIMQRLADDDLVGYVKSKEDWIVLSLATEFRANKKVFTKIGWSDWRKDEGELLFPELFPREVVDDIKEKEMSPNDFEAQHQQDPVKEGGARFLDKWFGRWEFTDRTCQFIKMRNPLTQVEDIIPFGTITFFVSLDSAVGEDRTNDYSVYVIWGKTTDGRYLVMDCYESRMSEPESISFAKNLVISKKYGKNYEYFAVEENGIGKPICQHFQIAGLNVVPIHVHTSKMAMSTTAIIKYANGKVHHPMRAPWLIGFEKQLTDFPLGNHDDIVSSVSIGMESTKFGNTIIKNSGQVMPAKKSGKELTGFESGNGNPLELPSSGRNLFGRDRMKR